MSDPGDQHGDQHDVGRHEAAQHDLASLALGEPIDPTLDEHVRTCAVCRDDLAAYRAVAELARASKRATDLPSGPPPRVWDRITAELGLSGEPRPAPADAATSSASEGSSAPAVVRPVRRRRALAAVAAVVALVGTGVAGWAIGHRESGSAANRAAQAQLAAQPGTDTRVRGEAVVHTSADGYTLSVTADGLPAPEGYYEVWLFNPSINQMVAVGTLGAGARGSFTVPNGIDLSAYHVVDVSAQNYDGNNRHERSVLRGALLP